MFVGILILRTNINSTNAWFYHMRIRLKLQIKNITNPTALYFCLTGSCRLFANIQRYIQM